MTRAVLLFFSIAISVATVSAQAPFRGMKYRIPTDANTLILINAEKMFNAPVADRERWDARAKAAFEAGLSALPPDAKEVVLAGRIDAEYMKSIWELAMMRLEGERNVSTVAQRFGGSMDTIEGRTAAKLPNDKYIVQIADDLLGTHTPANRQDVARWLRQTDTISTTQKLSPYLEKAFDYGIKVGTPIVMAMDVTDALSENQIRQRLEGSELLEAAGVDIAKLANLISGVNGITLGISLGDKAFGAIRVDFASAPTALDKVGKELLIEILRRNGAMIDDVENWQPSIKDNTFMLSGDLSANGTRRVMSVLELPQSLADAMQQASSPGVDQEGTAERLASQQYYNSVSTLVEDLREKPKRDKVKTFGQAAAWYDKYARKIDGLPILNVDEALLAYGSDISALFRQAEMAMKGVGMRASNRRASNNPTSGGYSYSGGGYRAGWGDLGAAYGSYGYSVSMGAGRASLQEKGRTDAIITRQERSKGAATVQEIWQVIDQSTAEVRKAMTQKYQVEF